MTEKGGYFITMSIARRLRRTPDIILLQNQDAQETIVFGSSMQKGEPLHTAYYRITRGRRARYVVGGGITRADALKGIGLDVFYRVEEKNKKS